jgi:N-terminal region of glycosyl transferase group 7
MNAMTRKLAVPLAIAFLTLSNLFDPHDILSLWNSKALLERVTFPHDPDALITTRSTVTTAHFLDPFYFERPSSHWLIDAPPSNASHHAIIIPYRDRQYHLDSFLQYMNTFPTTPLQFGLSSKMTTNSSIERGWPMLACEK